MIVNTNVINKGWLAPKIDETWAWEDILRVAQADWEQPQDFAVHNEENESFTFIATQEGSPVTFSVEMLPADCGCSSWQACICEKDLNGTYTSLYDCEHDGMNYNSCCSQVNAPIPAITIPLAPAPLVTISPTPAQYVPPEPGSGKSGGQPD